MAEQIAEVLALIARVVAGMVRNAALRPQIEAEVHDALVESCLRGSNPSRLTSSWVGTVTRRAVYRRQHRGDLSGSLDLDVLPAPDVAPERCRDRRLDAVLDQALARLGPKARLACSAYRSTGSISAAARVSGLSAPNVCRSLRRLRELCLQILETMTTPRHSSSNPNRD